MNYMKTKVFYDGLCKVCRFEIDHYRRQRGADDLEFVDITSNAFDARQEGLDPQHVHRVMHVKRSDGSLALGPDAFREIWKNLPQYRPLFRITDNQFAGALLQLFYSAFVRVRPYLPRYRESCSESPYCESRNFSSKH